MNGGEPKSNKTLAYMKIANGVEMLEIPMNFLGRKDKIHPTLLWSNEDAVLIDTGMPGQLNLFKDEMNKVGVPLSNLSKIILTHQDIDHIGSLPEFVQNQELVVYSHEMDKPFIEGTQPLIKMNADRISSLMDALPEDERNKAKEMFSVIPQAEVQRTIADKEVLPHFGGVTVIYTPGHTPGHISLYLNESKTLIAGDAMVVADGQLQGPNPMATPDMDSAMDSLKKFTEYDIERVICYHGGLFDDHVNERIVELIQNR